MKRLFLLPLLALFFLSGCQDGSGGDDSPKDDLEKGKWARIAYVYYELIPQWETDTTFDMVHVGLERTTPDESGKIIRTGFSVDRWCGYESEYEGKLRAGEWVLTVKNCLDGTTLTETVSIPSDTRMVMTFRKDGSYTKRWESCPTTKYSMCPLF